jgi:hypothetical protein
MDKLLTVIARENTSHKKQTKKVSDTEKGDVLKAAWCGALKSSNTLFWHACFSKVMAISWHSNRISITRQYKPWTTLIRKQVLNIEIAMLSNQANQ